MAAKRKSPQHPQVKQLRAQVLKLRAQLAQEARRRKIETRIVRESKKARARVLGQVAALRKQGLKLAGQLKAALGDAAKSRQKARNDAMAKLTALRTELGRRTEELRHKSAELAKLARESAERARDIIMEPAEAASEAAPFEAREAQLGAEPKEPTT